MCDALQNVISGLSTWISYKQQFFVRYFELLMSKITVAPLAQSHDSAARDDEIPQSNSYAAVDEAQSNGAFNNNFVLRILQDNQSEQLQFEMNAYQEQLQNFKLPRIPKFAMRGGGQKAGQKLRISRQMTYYAQDMAKSMSNWLVYQFPNVQMKLIQRVLACCKLPQLKKNDYKIIVDFCTKVVNSEANLGSVSQIMDHFLEDRRKEVWDSLELHVQDRIRSKLEKLSAERRRFVQFDFPLYLNQQKRSQI